MGFVVFSGDVAVCSRVLGGFGVWRVFKVISFI